MMTASRRIGLIIMAKSPQPGLAKTRLIPALGADGAARLAEQLLEHTIEVASQAKGFSHHELCVTPDVNDPVFTKHPKIKITNKTVSGHGIGFYVTSQGEGDLGARMQRAFGRVFENVDLAIMIGTDAPSLTANHLEQAARDLEAHDAVLVPARDGGYTLIGLNQCIPSLFENMPWSTKRLMDETRRQLKRLGKTWHEYAHMADIDEPADLALLPETFTK
ncbi:TIGR04282 family arsenosugar biosynthesis glycosyltransferase [Zwartia panacis]|uniref:TIGR04282 family arsenosugar biosynthesis glycosyltransferase n=1 Tax=Zwartia panacis TaxID=2683345 RepID=UPI0025B4D653|nr:TIGR04282 family arsenosugar biosynthesis glycosyltransferase [Zwartia panacis]MDN4017640.1 TIGR04282 family arsenosugar biosynthesis glycosyltransferase [Zwartia panacis]